MTKSTTPTKQMAYPYTCARCCESNATIAFATAIILVSGIMWLRYQLELPFLIKNVVSVLDVSHLLSIGIGFVSLTYIAIQVIKNCKAYHLQRKAVQYPPLPVQGRRKFKPVGNEDSKPLNNKVSSGTKSFQTQAQSVQILPEPAKVSWMDRLRYRFISNGAGFTAKVIDLYPGEIDINNPEFNCFFYGLIGGLMQEDPSQSQWKLENFVAVNHLRPGATFANATTNDLRLATRSLRAQIGNKDLQKWQKEFADHAGGPGFYTIWSLLRRTDRLCHFLDPKNKVYANNHAHPLLFSELNRNIAQLQTIPLFQKLTTWDDKNTHHIDGPPIWEEYNKNKSIWFDEQGNLKNNAPIEDIQRFVVALKCSLKPITFGYSQPHASKENPGVEKARPKLYAMYFTQLNREQLELQESWFTAFLQTLANNIEAGVVEAPECIDIEILAANAFRDRFKEINFEDCRAITEALDCIAEVTKENELIAHKQLWQDTLFRLGAKLDNGKYIPPKKVEANVITPADKLALAISTLRRWIAHNEKNLDAQNKRKLLKAFDILLTKHSKIANNKNMVDMGVTQPPTIQRFFQKRCESGTQMSLLACLTASEILQRKIIYLFPGEIPQVIQSSYANNDKVPILYLYHNGSNHWMSIEKVGAEALCTSSLKLHQLAATAFGTVKTQFQKEAIIR